jgi:GxxExxY protein
VEKDLLHSDLTKVIIGSAYYVYNQLGYGFLEKVYENALTIQLRRYGRQVEQQVPVVVRFEGEVVGEFFPDLFVERKVIVELKAVSELNPIHEVQLVNYLKATGIKVGLLINFGPQIKIIRRVLDPDQRNANDWNVREEIQPYSSNIGFEDSCGQQMLVQDPDC